MPTSSPRYWTELTPDPRLRSGLVIVSTLMLGAGPVLVGRLPLAPAVAFVAGCAWVLGAGVSLARVILSFRRCGCLRMASDGAIEIELADGRAVRGELVTGSVVLAGCAWLRYRLEDGRYGADLFTGNARESRAWRRLQVIWRHLGTGLGTGP